MFYTTEQLINSIKVRSLIPSAQSTFSDTDLITLLNEEMQISMVPDILSIREDFFLDSETEALVDLVPEYRVPERAIGNALKEIFYVDANGNRRSLPRKSPEDLSFTSESGSEPEFFVVKGDAVVIVPTPSNPTGELEFWYYSRPNELVATSRVGKITAISSLAGTTTITIDNDLTGTIAVGGMVDLLSVRSPFTLWAQNVTVTAIGSSSVQVATASITNEAGSVLPQVNDYLCVAQQANIPQVPQEFHPILAQMVACRAVEALGDLQKLQAMNVKLSEMRKQAFQIIANRVDSEVQRVTKRYGISAHAGYVSSNVLR